MQPGGDMAAVRGYLFGASPVFGTEWLFIVEQTVTHKLDSSYFRKLFKASA